ncbi:site-specific integrase [Flagellimonas pacifica]|nr:site-specific integrase [Allomuricauda parva]
MKTFLSLVLDTRRKKKDGSFPIILRLTHFRKTTSISTGFSVPKKYWNSRKTEITKNYPNADSVHRLNNLLLKEKTKANDIINKLYDEKKLHYMSIDDVKNRIVKNHKYVSFIGYGYSLVEDLKKSHRYGTARSYKGSLSILRTFMNGRDLKFNEFNYSFILKFEKYHLSKGNSLNSLSSYLRSYRAIFNKGIKEGLIDREAYPFFNYTIRQTPTKKRAIDFKYIKRIVDLELPKDTTLFRYRNYFICSYLLYGMNFTDMAYLKLENIVDSRLKFRRKKTGKLFDIKITDTLKEILSIYTDGKSQQDYIFPIIKRSSLEIQEREIAWERKRYNAGLKEIAKLCGIEEKLTTYVSRHTFATQALLKNIPVMAISAMLGHSKLDTTQIYLKSLPTTMLDNYHERVSNF